MTIGFGYASEHEAFEKRYPLFAPAMARIATVVDTMYVRTMADLSVPDQVVYLLARLAISDFTEIVLVCGNGCGDAGQKLVRGMFERVVTVFYLSQHPDEAQDYLDYEHIAERRTFNTIRRELPGTDMELLGPEIEARYEAVRIKYMVRVCKKCGREDVNFRWHKMDPASMAMAVGLSEFIVPAYTLSTIQIHDTVRALKSRVISADDRLMFDHRLQPELAGQVLFFSHGLLIRLLSKVASHFRFDETRMLLERCAGELGAVWGKSAAPEE